VSVGASGSTVGEWWIDAQLPPALAVWIAGWGTPARHVDDLGMLAAPDAEIFAAARSAGAVVVTKDEDFVRLLEVHGSPPQVVWLTVGNVRNVRLRQLFERHWAALSEQVSAGEALVELADG
jgi:predicted nuclease of predicted toxin-antitoxin system